MAIDYDAIIEQFPWVVQRGMNCILSPDSDGFLCALLVTQQLDWSVKGFYDDKILLLEDGTDMKDCVFLDVDVNRPDIRSIGHHIVLYNKTLLARLEADGYFDYSNCIQPNNMRGFDGKNDFQRKYPFGTVHLLLGILGHPSDNEVTIPPEGIWPLLFVDGVWNNLFGYTENCLEWINWLGITAPEHVLNSFFCAADYSFYEIMQGLDSFLRVRDQYNATGTYRDGVFSPGGRTKRTGHQLRISDPRGDPINIALDQGQATYCIHNNERDRVVGFIREMSERTGWPYQEDKWCWEGLRLTTYKKGDFSAERLNNGTYSKMVSLRPFSMAMTSGNNIEYTHVLPTTTE